MGDIHESTLGVAQEQSVRHPKAKLLGSNGNPDGRFWYRSGLSLFTKDSVAPPDFLKRYERSCLPAAEIATGDLVVFFRTDRPLYKEQIGEDWFIDTSRLNLLRLGVAYTDATDQVRVVSQDEEGSVWDHSIDGLPGYSGDDWDYYGLRLPPQQSVLEEPLTVRPLEVLDTWLKLK